MQVIFKLGNYYLYFCICFVAMEDVQHASFRLKIWVIMWFSTLAPQIADYGSSRLANWFASLQNRPPAHSSWTDKWKY